MKALGLKTKRFFPYTKIISEDEAEVEEEISIIQYVKLPYS